MQKGESTLERQALHLAPDWPIFEKTCAPGRDMCSAKANNEQIRYMGDAAEPMIVRNHCPPPYLINDSWSLEFGILKSKGAKKKYGV